jgi:hypothetical protein
MPRNKKQDKKPNRRKVNIKPQKVKKIIKIKKA